MGSSKGFTVIEIMIAVAISTIVAMAAFNVLLDGTQNYEASIGKVEARKILSGSAQALSRVFSGTYNVVQVANVAANIGSPTAPGQMRVGAWNLLSGANPPGSWVTLANIRRDTGVGAKLADRRSTFQATGIFYRMPTPTTSGILFINPGAQAVMTPSYSNNYFDRITELVFDRVQTTQGTTPPYIKGFHVKITVRLFLPGKKTLWKWCPEQNIIANYPGCSPVAPYKDYTGEFNISIPNQANRFPDNINNLDAPERTLGPIYLFPFLN